MFKIRLAAFTVALLAAVTANASAQQMTQAGLGAALPEGKVAVVNTQAFPAGIGELKQKYDQVDKQFQSRYQQLQTVETQLKQMENDIQVKGQTLAPDKLQELQNNYADLKRRGTRDYEDLKAEYDRQIDTATKPIRDKLFQFLNGYATQRNITLVINLAGAAQTGSLAYWNPGSDITEDFVTEYNKANPVAGGAPAPAGQPVKPPVKPAGKP
jgi:Skp family chaperone for outer membrane proteins